jgi:hypothetical protein
LANAAIAASRVAVRRLLSVGRIEAVGPKPRRSDRRRRRVDDPADHDTVGEHVVIVVVPLAGWA